MALYGPSLGKPESEGDMWNLRRSKAFAVGLSTVSILSMGSLAQTVAVFQAEQAARALPGVQPAIVPQVPHLPIGNLPGTSTYAGPRLQGSYGILSLNNKTGAISYSEAPRFDDPSNPDDPIRGYNSTKPFTPAMQGLTDRQ